MDAGLKEAFVAIVPLCEIELGCEPLARARRTSNAPPSDLRPLTSDLFSFLLSPFSFLLLPSSFLPGAFAMLSA